MLIDCPPKLIATSQTSRFHVNEHQASFSADLELKNINLSIDKHHLLEDANLQLFNGVRYGLIGRNGVGKSLLLKCLANRWIPGVPSDVSIFYVDQLESEEKLNTKVIDLILKTKLDSWNAWQQIDMLAEAIDSDSEEKMREALFQIRKFNFEQELAQAQRISARTSGQRGLDARKRVVMLEKNLQKFTIEDLPTDVPVQMSIQKHLEELYEVAEDRDEMRVRAEQILKSFGLKSEHLQISVGKLSGGWRIRVALAMAVFVEPQILLLDEPTNHLDITGILWLKKYMQTLDDVTLVVVSHDRGFLDATIDQTIIMQGKQLIVHDGNYESYLETQEELKLHRAKQRDAINRKKAKAEQSIQKDLVDAHRRKNDKKLAQVASRRKKLEERSGIEKNAKGHRFKLNRDRAGRHFGKRFQVEDEYVDPKLKWKLPVPSPLRSPGPILQVNHLDFAYDFDESKSDGDIHWILRDVNLVVDQKARIAIVGQNGQGTQCTSSYVNSHYHHRLHGSGKSTLMKLFAEQLQPNRGIRQAHTQCNISYFEQHFVDLACGRTETAYDHISSIYPSLSEKEIFAALGSFNLAPFAHQGLNTFSGGQVVRFAFALMSLENPHAVFLDEPSNHLDLDASEALRECLLGYEGAVVFVSHDIYFIRAMKCSHVYDVFETFVRDIGSIDKYRPPKTIPLCKDQ